MENINSIFNLDGENFGEAVSDEFILLRKTNEIYKNKVQEEETILDSYPSLRDILEDFTAKELSVKECEMLIKVILSRDDRRIMEEKALFFLGGRECYNYLNKMNLIKN